MATLLRDRGCEVRLTPQSRDGGRDILAVFKTSIGDILTVVECKRFAPHWKIGQGIVERFLFTVQQRDRASCGLIATTSYFTSEARRLEKDYTWQLRLYDHESIQRMVG